MCESLHDKIVTKQLKIKLNYMDFHLIDGFGVEFSFIVM